MGIKMFKKLNFKCIGCGIEKYIRPSNLSRYKYCSIECKVNSNRTTIKCPECKKEFNVQKYDIRGNNKYCSWNCYEKGISTRRKKWWNENSIEKEKIRIQHVGKNNSNYKNGQYSKQEINCQVCNKIFFNEPTYKFCSQKCFGEHMKILMRGESNPSKRIDVKKKQSEKALRRTKNHELYIYSKHGYREDLGCWFRSSWEANIARYLNFIDKPWIFEDKYINLPNGTKYLPDFYLPKEDRFIEVKGYFSEKSKEKINLASKLCNLELISSEKYYTIQNEFSDKIKYWEN